MKRLKFIIRPKQPFSFDLTAKVFSDEVRLGMRDGEICKYSNGKYWRVLRINNKLVLITVESLGDANKSRLEVELISDEQFSEKDKEDAEEIISYIFDLKSELRSFYDAMKQDNLISKLINKLYGLKINRCPSIFEAIVYVILEQQISLQAAYNIERRFIKEFGIKLKVDNRAYYEFPTPKKLSLLEISDLHSCGMSRRKAEYIRDIAKSVVERKLDLEALKHKKEDEEIMKELCNIRGVGRWTAELVMIRGMGKLTVIPADDLGLRDHVSHFYFGDEKGRVSSEDVREISEKWGKWKGLAGFYLVMAGRLKIDV